jgi:hypothetical protein
MRFDYRRHNSLEKILSAAIQFFSTQKEQSKQMNDDFDGCAYRKENVRKATVTCIVGAFVPDSCYSPSLEGKCVNDLIAHLHHKRLFAHWLNKYQKLLCDLQKAHDCEGHWDSNGFNHFGFRYLAAILTHWSPTLSSEQNAELAKQLEAAAKKVSHAT